MWKKKRQIKKNEGSYEEIVQEKKKKKICTNKMNAPNFLKQSTIAVLIAQFRWTYIHGRTLFQNVPGKMHL